MWEKITQGNPISNRRMSLSAEHQVCVLKNRRDPLQLCQYAGGVPPLSRYDPSLITVRLLTKIFSCTTIWQQLTQHDGHNHHDILQLRLESKPKLPLKEDQTSRYHVIDSTQEHIHHLSCVTDQFWSTPVPDSVFISSSIFISSQNAENNASVHQRSNQEPTSTILIWSVQSWQLQQYPTI